MFTFIKSVILGFISGCAQILPISSRAHKGILLKIFGMQSSVPFSDLLIHIGVIAAVYYTCSQAISEIRREGRSLPRGKGRTYRTPAFFDRKLLKTAWIPMVLGQLLILTTSGMNSKLLYIALFLAINAAILFLQDHASHGNRNASHFSAIESILFGFSSILSCFPGVSRIGVMLSFGVIRGADQQKVVDWVLLLTIPATILLCIFDLITIITVGFGITSFLTFLYCLISGITAFAGAYLAIRLIKSLAANNGFSVFSYYCLGAALLSVVLYLIS